MLKNDVCIIVIRQVVLEMFPFKVDIPRKRPKIRISLDVRIKCAENRIRDVIGDLLIINFLTQIHHISVI